MIGIFLIFFGLVFASIPLFGLVSILSIGGFEMIIFTPFISIFIFAGIFATIKGFKMVNIYLSTKKLKENGKIGVGTFISSTSNSSNFSSNYTSNLTIEFSFVNDYGKTIKIKTTDTYSFQEANYYAKLKTFEIRHNNKLAVITQPVDYTAFESNYSNTYSPRLRQDFNGAQIATPPRTEYHCQYCNNIQEQSGKCKNCGAIVKKHK